MNRREMLKMLAAGGVVTAAGIWMPGEKLISIPSKKVFYGPSLFELDGQTIRYVGADNRFVTIQEFYNWLKGQVRDVMSAESSETMVHLKGELRMENPEYLAGGTLSQATEENRPPHLREMWSCANSLGDDDLFVDKVYYTEFCSPKERIRELDNGHRGYR